MILNLLIGCRFLSHQNKGREMIVLTRHLKIEADRRAGKRPGEVGFGQALKQQRLAGSSKRRRLEKLEKWRGETKKDLHTILSAG